MRRLFTTVMAAMMLCTCSNLFAGKGENLLPNRGFEDITTNSSFPAKGWQFNYNKEVKSLFINDKLLQDKNLVLKVSNPVKDKGITINNRATSFQFRKPGKYNASIWIRAEKGTLALPKKKLTAVIRVLSTDWKTGFSSKAIFLHDKWLKYEFEFHLPDSKLEKKYFFRVDINGSGTYYLAQPSLTSVSEKFTEKKLLPLKETGYLSFNKNLNENKKNIAPEKASKAELMEGYLGKAVNVADGGQLSYPVDKLLKGESGTVSMWIKTTMDPTPTFIQTDTVGFTISGRDETGKFKETIIRGNISTPNFSSTFYSAYGTNGAKYLRPPKIYFGNEWRHYTFTWDCDNGMQLYIDGRLATNNNSFRIFPNLKKVTLEKINFFTSTGDIEEEKAFFDEIKFFNRGLSKTEVLELYQEYVPAYPVLLDYATIAGSNKPFRVKILKDIKSKTRKLTIAAEDSLGKVVYKQTLKVRKPGNYNINFHPSKTGIYHLVFKYNNKRIRTFEVTAITDKTTTSTMPISTSGKVKRKLIDSIDCTQDLPASRYVDDGKVTVVDSSIGKYRTSTRTSFIAAKQYGFAYSMTIKNPGKAHWLEIEYPDDKPRVFYVVLDQKLDNHLLNNETYTQTYSLDTIGISNGFNNPVTGKMATKRLLFWPDSTQLVVACFGYKTFSNCFGPAMKSINIYENDGPLPQIAVNTPDNMPKRMVGNWNEDPAMPDGCWFNRYKANQGPDFNFFEEKMRRRIQYIKFTGQNETAFQLFDYSGDRNGNQAIFPPKGIMPGWACLAATMFEREKVPFYIQFNDRGPGFPSMIGMDKISADIYETSAKGAKALEMVSADGSLIKNNSSVLLNFLQPEVREQHLKRIRFYKEQFGIYDSFKGFSYWYTKTIMFRNEKTGYGDYTIKLFEKETGIKIPVDDKTTSRYKKRYNWLKASNAWDKWLNWRCAKITEFIMSLVNELNSGSKKDYKIILPFHLESRVSFLEESATNYPEIVNLKKGFKSMGIDLDTLSSHPSLIIEPVAAPNYGFNYKKGEMVNMDAVWYSDNFASLYQKSKYPALMLSRHANAEVYITRPAIKKYWWPRGYWGNNGGFHCFSSLLPDNKYLPQTLAWYLANTDLQQIDHGWWGNPENGAHYQFQQFYRAYQSIPAVPFKKVAGTNDPVMLRQYNGKKGWFYLVNTQFYKTKVEITFAAKPDLTDAIFNRPVILKGNVLTFELDPYQIICCNSPKPLNITTCKQIVPEKIVNEMTQMVNNLATGAKLVKSKQAELLLQTAKNMLKEKRYSALYYLSRSYSAQKILKDTETTAMLKIDLNPDSGELIAAVTNMVDEAISLDMELILPAGLTSPDKIKKLSMKAKENKVLTFNLPELNLKKTNCQKELNFAIKTVVNNSKVETRKITFRPAISEAAGSIKIDGDLSEWKKSKWYKLSKPNNKVVPRGTTYLESFDSLFSSKWSKNGLYLAVLIKEKDLVPAPGDSIAWQYDFFEIMFDQTNNTPYGVNDMDNDDCVFNICNIKNKIKVYMKAGKQNTDMTSRCLVKQQRGKDATAYELFIPAGVLDKAVFKPGKSVGFALKVHNREHTGKPGHDLWGFMTSTQDYPCNAPNTWNDLLFSGRN